MGFQRSSSLSIAPVLSSALLYSLPLYLPSSYLSGSIPPSSAVPVSLANRIFDWGQTLGFHTIYNAALSNGIEYGRG